MADCVPVAPGDIVEMADLAEKLKMDLTVVGPELPLALGIADEFGKRDLPIFGPSRLAAQIEASKVFAKDLMARHGIPTAAFRVFTRADQARAYCRERGLEWVEDVSNSDPRFARARVRGPRSRAIGRSPAR